VAGAGDTAALPRLKQRRRAIGRYERMGFSVEGHRVQCLVIDGQLVDELCMAVILADNEATAKGGTP